MKKLLLTGFEPFNGYSVNPSAELAKSFDGHVVGKFEVAGLVLPLDYKNALDILDKAIEKHKPSTIICCGQANRATITIERLALNVLNTDRSDNYGNTPETDIIDSEGPAAYFTNIAPGPLVQALKNQGIPAHVSYHAGTYGCNWLIYNVMNRIEKNHMGIMATFVHVPPLPFQAIQKDMQSLATLPLDVQKQALETIILSL